MRTRVMIMSMCFGLAAPLAGTVVAVNIETVLVGDPGNSADMRYELLERPEGYGRVDYSYRIGKHEVTAGQYCEFLNAVAKVDTYGLYHWAMSDTDYYEGCSIQRNGSSGYYTYSVASDWANRPVNWVSWGDAARFANWLHNGQPSGSQNLSTTEDGAYFLNGAVTNAALLAVTRKENATWAIASEDEWYKAAYYDPAKPGGAGYWDFATRSNTSPSNVLDPNGTNNANYYDSTGDTIGAPYYRTEVGAFVGSRSFAGTFDQAGNVWEWNETVWYNVEPVLRGGCYGNMDAVMLSASYRNHVPPTDSYRTIGFRVVEVPEPATLLLLALGGLAVMRKRRGTTA